MKSLYAFVWTVITVYLLGAFVAADFDIRNWPAIGRFVVLSIAVIASLWAAKEEEES